VSRAAGQSGARTSLAWATVNRASFHISGPVRTYAVIATGAAGSSARRCGTPLTYWNEESPRNNRINRDYDSGQTGGDGAGRIISGWKMRLSWDRPNDGPASIWAITVGATGERATPGRNRSRTNK